MRLQVKKYVRDGDEKIIHFLDSDLSEYRLIHTHISLQHEIAGRMQADQFDVSNSGN